MASLGGVHMDSGDLIRAGRLAEARKRVTEEVRALPADLGKRTLLFQVLAFCGEWAKAGQHLDAIVAQDPKRETAVQIYKNLVDAERERQEVSKLAKRPAFLPGTPLYAEIHFAALQKLFDQKAEEAQSLFDQIEAGRSEVRGTLDGKAFVGFEDIDSFLSSFLEVMVHGRYVWIPFESIQRIVLSPPKTLSDLLWIQGEVTTWEGLVLNCHLPVLYPGSFSHEDERIKLGKMTDWIPLGGALSRGVGQHVYQIGDQEKALLEIREVLFDPPEKVEGHEKND
jgi:type VI secretion system protein ImpE